MKYKVGDKVRIRKDLESGNKYGVNYVNDEMLQYKGKQAIIKKVLKVCEEYIIDIDNKGYYWTDEMLEPVKKNEVSTNSVDSIDQFTKKDFKFGDIITLRDKLKGIFTTEEIHYNDSSFNSIIDFNNDLKHKMDNNCDIIKVERYVKKQTLNNDYTLQTLYTRKEEILDKEEKEYLSAVIKPFRKRIKYISKTYEEYYVRFYIKIELNNEEIFSLPYFEEDEIMYKGMELDKEYTLKELGL